MIARRGTFLALAALLALSVPLRAQKLVNAPTAALSSVHLLPQAQDVALAGPTIPGPSGKSQPAKDASNGPASDRLTLQQAEQIALRNNPHVRVSDLLARAQHQVMRETRSAYLPQVEGGIVSERAKSGSRFTFDELGSTRLLTHAGGGVTLDQLIFDFGRTANLIASSKLTEKARKANAMADRLDVVLVTDQAFYSALEAQALVKLAQQTVSTRTTTNRQIAELTQNKLRSDIDLAFAEENVAQANLLLLDAQSQYETALNALNSVLGFDRPRNFHLVDVASAVPLPPPDRDALVQLALRQRPDLAALDYDSQAEKKFSRAQREQMFPTIGTTGAVGITPVRTDQDFTGNWFGAVGLTLKVPLFNGFLDTAQAAEAADRARAAEENLRGLRDSVVRDVRNAWLQTNTSYQKIAATQKFLDASNMGLHLAEERYRLGLSSIVELSQAQLAQTQASIENVNARFAYELSLAALNYQVGNLP